MNDKKNNEHIRGVVCDVRNCIHHGEANYCHAECIAIGPKNAENEDETLCATFQPKEY